MAKVKLKINQKVEIQLQNGSYAGSHPSRVEEIFPDKIIFAAPLKRGMAIPLKKGDVITVHYWGQTAGYSFTTKILETKLQRLLPVIVAAKPEKVTRIQRRNFLRIPVALRLTFSILEDLEHNSGSEIFHTETVDLSGGGVMIKSPVKLLRDQCLEIELTLPRKGTINVTGKVVRIQETKGKGKPIYLVGIDFLVIKESDRDKIVAFVFEYERKMRKKGLI